MFSLYVHIPYCRQKCPYCDFNSYAGTSWPERRYTEALLGEIRHAAGLAAWSDKGTATIFFGGGTPSLFAPSSIARVLAGVREWFPVAPDAEITIEANPGTVGSDALQELRAAGVNRLSFGIQSLQEPHLATLGRAHSAEEARAAFELARVTGFDTINTDLMFGIPGQSVEDWHADLAAMIRLAPGHISAYSLTYEEGSPFHAWRAEGVVRPIPEDDEASMFTETARVLRGAGYEHYEISNHALPGKACRHNLSYWRRQPYLGVGAGAHSFASTPPYGHRYANARPPEQYMDLISHQGHAVVMDEHPSREQAIGEFFFLGLRLLEGIACDGFTALFGTPPEQARPALGSLVKADLLETVEARIRLTTEGLLQADSVFVALL